MTDDPTALEAAIEAVDEPVGVQEWVDVAVVWHERCQTLARAARAAVIEIAELELSLAVVANDDD